MITEITREELPPLWEGQLERVLSAPVLCSVWNECKTFLLPALKSIHRCFSATEELGALSNYFDGIDEEDNCDTHSLILSLPYTDQCLIWEVIFKTGESEAPPDFTFDFEDFFPDFKDIPRLAEWDLKKPDSLLSVIEDLLARYRIYHRDAIKNRLSDGGGLHDQLSTLEGLGTFTDIVTYVGQHRNVAGPVPVVNILMTINIDFQSIPPKLCRDNLGPHKAMLLLSYQSRNSNLARPKPSLYLSAGVQHAISFSSSAENWKLPQFETGVSLTEYAVNIEESLKQMIASIVQSYRKRKEYVSALLANFGRAVTEYDADSFWSFTCLLEVNRFSFLLKIMFPDKFPTCSPKLVFQSLYYLRRNRSIIIQNINSIPNYDSEWNGIQCVDSIKEYVFSQSENFKTFSNQ